MEDYAESAVRHYADAKRLKDGGRLDNAGQLMGFAAECAIKARIHELADEVEIPRSHMPKLLENAKRHLCACDPKGSMLRVINESTFQDWDVARRYYSTGHTTSDEFNSWSRVTRRLLGAAKIRVPA